MREADCVDGPISVTVEIFDNFEDATTAEAFQCLRRDNALATTGAWLPSVVGRSRCSISAGKCLGVGRAFSISIVL
jgi:hypothetical protein